MFVFFGVGLGVVYVVVEVVGNSVVDVVVVEVVVVVVEVVVILISQVKPSNPSVH